jgi:hypothetical protein
MNLVDQLDRDRAMTVPCPVPACPADVGEPCRNLSTGEPVDRIPAHARRLTAAGVSHAPVPSAEVRGDDVPRRRR